jgi:DNA-binding SARP family transcriptional activator
VTSTSAELLEELASKHLFVTPATDGDGYLVHDVLGAHLRGRIVHDRGEAELNRRHAAAGALLEARSYLAEAFEAFARAGQWHDARRILLQRDGSLEERVSWVFDQAPEGVMKDPWWTLASARRHRGEGQLQEAIAGYERVEANELSDAASETARRERLQLVGFLRPNSPTADRWIAVVRDALLGANSPVEGDGDVAFDAAMSLAAVLTDVPGARERILAADTEDVPDGLRLVCVSVGLLDDWLNDRPIDAGRWRVSDLVSSATAPWLERFAVAVGAATTGERQPVDAMALAALGGDDPLGAAVADLLCRLIDAVGGARFVEHEESTIPGVERWAARRMAARQAGGRQSLVTTAPVERQHGRSSVEYQSVSANPRVQVRCFGGFALVVDGEDIDLSDLRPRARDVLRILAAAGGEPVHEEVIVDSLWLDGGRRAKPRLQTAVSACRGFLSSELGEAVCIERSEHSYRLVVSGEIDVARFYDLDREGRRLVLSSPDESAALLAEALDLSEGELLPECGPSDWAVQLRTAVDRRRVRAAAALAGARRAGGDLRGAAEACERGLESDRFDAGLWSTLIDLTESSGDDAWHAFVSARHTSVLAELQAN